MDLTETPEDVRDGGEEPPDFSEWDEPAVAVRGGPIRERMLDVILQVREPTKVSAIAERADCDTETARNYLEWFAEMGMVREISGRPIRYERNDSYWKWRRVEQIREQYSEREIVHALGETMERIEGYRERFGVESPDEVSLVDGEPDLTVEEAWEAVSEWQTLERRATLLDTARREQSRSGDPVGRIDA